MRDTQDKIALIALVVLAAWLLIGLPLIYLPSAEHVHGEILGVKYGEWLLFFATIMLAWTTWLLVKGAEKTAERQLRAYVITLPTGIALDRDKIDLIGINFTNKNSGQTPAYKTQLRAIVRQLPKPLPKGFVFEVPDVQEYAETAIGPGQDVSGVKWTSVTETPAQITAAGDGIYLYAITSYLDAFGKIRNTKVCCLVQNLAEVVSAMRAGDPSIKSRFSLVEGYNLSD
jgi:hypothetical protein